MKRTARPNKVVNVKGLLPADWLLAFSRAHPLVGLGLDVGTTTKKKSNPSVLAICQKVGHEYRWPLIVRYKSKDPAVTQALIEEIAAGLASIGLRLRRGCIDATSEKYFAVDLKKHFAGKLPFDLIVNSENTTYGNEVMLWKSYLGNLIVNTIEDGYAALPGELWVKNDIRSVTTDKGTFEAEILEDGGHGDVFDGCKLSLHAIIAKGGTGEIAAAGVGVRGAPRVRDGVKNLLARRHERTSSPALRRYR